MSPAGIVTLTIIGCIVLMDIIVLNIILFDTKDEKEESKALETYKKALTNYQKYSNHDEEPNYELREIRNRISNLEELVEEDRRDLEGMDSRLEGMDDDIQQLYNHNAGITKYISNHINNLKDDISEKLENRNIQILDELSNFRVKLDDLQLRLIYLEEKGTPKMELNECQSDSVILKKKKRMEAEDD